jgi:hypothetical protein
MYVNRFGITIKCIEIDQKLTKKRGVVDQDNFLWSSKKSDSFQRVNQ